MINLHKYYYKDYFSEHIVGVDEENNDKLSFEHLYRKEEREREHEDVKKKELSSIISSIETKNEAILKFRNSKLTGTDFVQKVKNGHLEKPTRILLEDANITLDKAITEDCQLSERKYDFFDLTVQYPGLVTGIGIDHETTIKGEFKLGLHFDWTHGMPVIYGSSVKGVLQSWFVDVYKTSNNNYSACRIDADDLLMDIFSGKVRDIESEKKKCEEEWKKKINSGRVEQTDANKIKHDEEWRKRLKDVKNRIYKSKSIYDRDIFFDAVITEADSKGRILCSDSITPHGDNPLKNPIPITFLKIAPGCTIQFRFILQKSSIPTVDGNGNPVKDEHGEYPSFEIDKKKAIFQEILTTVGIGAKTNVGYGQLKAIPESK